MTTLATHHTTWPAMDRKFRGTPWGTYREEPAYTVVLAYAGMSVTLFYALLGVACAAVAALIIPLNIAHPEPGTRYPTLIAGLLVLAVIGKAVSLRLKPGALAATPNGIEFMPFNSQLTRPTGDPTLVIPWVNVLLERPGRVDFLGGGGLHLGKDARQFAEAARTHAGRSV